MHTHETRLRLSATPEASNVVIDELGPVTMVRTWSGPDTPPDAGYYFTWFNTETLEVYAAQRAPGSVDDPRADSDFDDWSNHTIRMVDTPRPLWRDYLSAPRRALLATFNPSTVVDAVNL